MRLLRQLHFTRKKFKINYYKRNNLVKLFLLLRILLILIFIFINNFKIYRNIYRALKVFY